LRPVNTEKGRTEILTEHEMNSRKKGKKFIQMEEYIASL